MIENDIDSAISAQRLFKYSVCIKRKNPKKLKVQAHNILEEVSTELLLRRYGMVKRAIPAISITNTFDKDSNAKPTSSADKKLATKK